MSKIVLITTEHSIQKYDYSALGEFRNILLYLISVFSPQLILEEWSADDYSTIGRHVADEKEGVSWHGISPPPELELSWLAYRNLDGLMLREYGPIALQISREQFMLAQIQKLIVGSQTAMLIAGLAHHQSLAEKLSGLGYEIEAFCWMKPGDPIPDFVSTVWKWVPSQ
jgi:hypothetical protein